MIVSGYEVLTSIKRLAKGGDGSGNFGHSGQGNGEVGGSGDGGGGGGRNPRETAFDRTFNEGGEGYNPYRDGNAYPSDRTIRSGVKRDSINRQLNAIDYNDPSNQPRIEKLRQEYKQTYEADGWTAGVSAERRQQWNTAIKSGKYTGRDGTINSDSLAKLEKDIGFSRGVLSDALRVHGLK